MYVCMYVCMYVHIPQHPGGGAVLRGVCVSSHSLPEVRPRNYSSTSIEVLL
jgi:hypothetical protein